MIKFTTRGRLTKTSRFLAKVQKVDYVQILHKYGRKGVQALSENTPLDTGLTASSWGYEIVQTNAGYNIYWSNSNIVDGVQIAVILQYGHGTGTGGYVKGVDYINPALKDVFDGIAKEAWREVTE